MTRLRALRRDRTRLLALLVGVAAAGCGDAPDYREPIAQGTGEVAGASALMFEALEASEDDAGVVDTGTGSEPVPGPPEVALTLTDGEFVGVLIAIHESEILLGLAAQSGATDPRVQSLGASVAADHRNERARQLMLGILPAPSDHATAYLQGATGLLGILQQQAAGAAYDAAYIELQITLDAIVTDQIDRQWASSTQNPELLAELALTREAIQRHLERTLALRGERLAAASP